MSMPNAPEGSLSTPAAIVAGLVYGLCVYASLPPLNIWPLTLLSAAVVIWTALRSLQRPCRLGFAFALGTLPLWFAEQSWLTNITPLGYPLLAFYMASWNGLTVWALARVRRIWPEWPLTITAPLVWMVIEVLRGEVVLTGYGWFHLAHPLIAVPALAAPGAVLGTYFVSFLAVAMVGGVADIWLDRPRGLKRFVGPVLVASIWALAAAMAMTTRPTNPRTVNIGIVQTNVPQGQKLKWSADRVKADFARFTALTRSIAATQPKPDLIVWPETMFPGVSLNDEAVKAFEAVFRANNPEAVDGDQTLNGAMNEAIRRLQAEIGIPMLVGSNEVAGPRLAREPDGRAAFEYDARYNSVVLIDGGRVVGPPNRYDKVDLTPFGEVIPYVWRWPAAQRAVLALGAGGMRFDLSPGSRESPIRVPLRRMSQESPAAMEVSVATPICFEATRSRLCRRLVVGKADSPPAELLINVSNDGWFGDVRLSPVNSDAGRAQHQLSARWRCVELGIPMIRAVNTGISGAIDSRGRRMKDRIVEGLARPIGTDGAMIATVEIGQAPTIFTRVGNVFAWVTMTVGIGLIAAALVRSKRLGPTLASTRPVPPAAR